MSSLRPAPTCPFTDWDAAYTLGALPAPEAQRFADHLPGCASCTAQVAALRGLPAALTRLGPDQQPLGPDQQPRDAEGVPPYAVVAARWRRRRTRVMAWGLAAALAVLAGSGAVAVGVAGGIPGGPAQPPVAAATSTGIPLTFTAPPGAEPLLQVTGVAESLVWGTRLSWSCDYPARGGTYPGPAATYELVLRDGAGRESVAASWRARPGERMSLTAATSVAVGDIDQVLIRVAGTGTSLLAARPAASP